MTAVATVFGAAVPAVVLLVLDGTNPLTTSGTALALLYLGLVTTAAACVLWSAGLAVFSLSDTVALTMIEPTAAVVLAVAILSEPAGPATVVGVLAALTGGWIATARNRPVARSGQPASSVAHGGFAPAREQVIAETLEANARAAVRPSSVNVSRRPPR